MKRWIAIIMLPFILIGCKAKNQSMNELYTFRESLLQSAETTFETEIIADYGQEYYTFCVSCIGNENGDLSFQVLQPDSIKGIQGNVTAGSGHLTFDENVLAFKTMADNRLTPVTAPWVFLRALRGGYITSCGKTDDGLLAVIRDNYEDNPLVLEVYFRDNTPISAEIFWNQTRIITMYIQNFNI